MGDLLDKVIEMLATLPAVESLYVQSIPVLKPRSRGARVTVEKSGEVFVVKSARAERIVRRVDLEDWSVQAQLWGELTKMGIVRALDRAGAKAGSLVRIGDWELEWK